jgi:hypothetical protein
VEAPLNTLFKFQNALISVYERLGLIYKIDKCHFVFFPTFFCWCGMLNLFLIFFINIDLKVD